MKIFIIIPAYNEERTIGDIIERAKHYGTVVVVDDGSVTEIRKFGNSEITNSNLRPHFLRHVVNRGQGAALKTGVDYALRQGAEVIVTMDADGQHQAEEIPWLIEPIKRREADIVLGSRFLKIQIGTDLMTDGHRSRIQVPRLKKWLILKPAIFFERVFTGLKLTDAHQGFRAMSREAAEKIRITQDRMAHATEIISEIKSQGLRYMEVRINVVYREYGQGFSGGFRILKDLLFRKVMS